MFYTPKGKKMLRQLLSQLGFNPITETETEAVYKSPFNPNERTPSFFVFPNRDGEWKNYKNYADGQGGDIYKFIMNYYNIPFPMAKMKLKEILGFSFNQQEPTQLAKPIYQVPPSKKSTAKKSYNIKKTQNLQNKALLAYLESRGIVIPTLTDKNPLKAFLGEVYYELKGRNYFALSFGNNSGGMEVRNENFKGSFGSKNFSHLLAVQTTKPKIIKDYFFEEGYEWILIDTGVPHLVALVDDISLFDKKIARTMRNRYNANVNFAKFEDGKLKVRTYERGVEDETLACGTGMCASFLSARNRNLSENFVKLNPKSGEELEVKIENETLYFKGKVTETFRAEVLI